MKINIRIGKLVLHGFNYHDHKRISAALEQELAKLISENGFPKSIAQEFGVTKIASSFNIPVDIDPRNIGTEIGRSIYKGLKKLRSYGTAQKRYSLRE